MVRQAVEGGTVSGLKRPKNLQGRPTVEAKREKMAEILEIARDHFVRDGYKVATMDAIAAAAGVTKRTLYHWHGDKASLFRACIVQGGQEFPTLDVDDGLDVRTQLVAYARGLVGQLAPERALGIGRLFPREGRDFPELGPIVQQSRQDYMIEPLAAYLVKHGLERENSVERTRLFVALALAQIHESILLGVPPPTPQEIESHVDRAVDIFLRGARLQPDVSV